MGLRSTAVIAGIEGAALVGYGLTTAVIAVTQGIAGPQAVSSPTGVVVEVVTFVLLGAGILAVAVGRARGAAWSVVPFVVTQLLALTVGIPLATGTAEARWWGIAVTGLAIGGLAALIVERAGTSEPATAADAEPPGR